jgi:Spy/CpxP family protein refolding chaperone
MVGATRAAVTTLTMGDGKCLPGPDIRGQTQELTTMIRILTVAALVSTVLPLIAIAESGEGPSVKLAGAAPAADQGAPPAAHIPGINPAALASLKLTADQRNKLTEIERDLKRKQWKLVGAIRELRWKQQDAFKAAEVDMEAVRRNYDETSALRKQMFDLALEGRKRVEGVLTKEQRVEVSEWTGPNQPAHRVVEPASDRKPR